MSRGVNKVILVGTVGKDPEVRFSQSGTANCSLSLATNESWKDKNGEKQERTEWHRLKLFGKLAEIAGDYVKKGQQLYIEGSLRTDKYTDKQGVERYTTDIMVSDLQMLGSRQSADSGGGAQGDGFSTPKPAGRGMGAAGAKPAPFPQPAAAADPFGDDVPF